MKREFTLEYWIDDGWYVGRLREVPGVFSQGESLDELEANIRDAYDLMVREDSGARPGGLHRRAARASLRGSRGAAAIGRMSSREAHRRDTAP